MKQFSKYIGLDVHKETIAVAVAEGDGGEVRFFGEIVNTSEALDKLVKQFSKAGDRVKTDRRDALSLARLHLAGELTAVWMPDGAQEALRDLTRVREDMKHLLLQSKQRLLAFLLRYRLEQALQSVRRAHPEGVQRIRLLAGGRNTDGLARDEPTRRHHGRG